MPSLFITFHLGWIERLAALQATCLVAGRDQPAKRAHPLRSEISLLRIECHKQTFQRISNEDEPSRQEFTQSAKSGCHRYALKIFPGRRILRRAGFLRIIRFLRYPAS